MKANVERHMLRVSFHNELVSCSVWRLLLIMLYRLTISGVVAVYERT